MIPHYQNLVAAKHKTLTGTMLTQVAPDGAAGDARRAGFNVTLTRTPAGDLLMEEAEPGAPDQGIYISYVVGKIAYFEMSAGETWLCSGPFSGCKFEIGRAGNGELYGAHIHMDAEHHLDENWDRQRHGVLGATSEVFRRRIKGLSEAVAEGIAGMGKNPAQVNSFVFVCLKGHRLEDAEWCKVTAATVAGHWKILRVEQA